MPQPQRVVLLFLFPVSSSAGGLAPLKTYWFSLLVLVALFTAEPGSRLAGNGQYILVLPLVIIPMMVLYLDLLPVGSACYANLLSRINLYADLG